MLRTRDSLFGGKAELYEEYRLKPSSDLIRFLVETLQLTLPARDKRYIDIGCGTGQFTFPLHSYFKEVVAVDSEASMITEGEHLAEEKNADNISWLCSCAEDLPKWEQPFNVINVANAFHYFDHEKVITWIKSNLEPEGNLVLIGLYRFPHEKKTLWESAAWQVIKRWFGTQYQYTTSSAELITSWEDTLRTYSFSVTHYRIPEKRIWTVDSYVGLFRTTSFFSRKKSDTDAQKFKEEMSEALLGINPKDEFVEEQDVSVIIAKPPQ